MKFRPLILPTANALIWGFLVWIGFDGEKYIEQRMGHVSLEQVMFYIAFPLAMLAIALVPSVLVSQTRYYQIGNVGSGLTLFAVLPYLFVYGGGV